MATKLTDPDFAIQLCATLRESYPRTMFHIYSLINLYGQKRATEALTTAKRLYGQGEMTKDGKRRTLGGCWFIQYTWAEKNAAFAHRQEMREVMALSKGEVPAGLFNLEVSF